jgi:hypothetical protein
MRIVLFAFLALLGFFHVSGAQSLAIGDFEPILVPTAVRTALVGAHGSVWQTEFSVRNDALEGVIFGQGEPICRLSTCPSLYLRIGPMTTETVTAGTVLPVPYVGTLFYVERARSSAVTMNLRLRETSRNPSAVGTNVPIIRESELRVGKIQLLNVPVDPLYRINVRVFEVDRSNNPEVAIRIFDRNDVLYTEHRKLFVPQVGDFAEYPAEDVVNGVENLISPEACCGPLRIEIEPLQTGRYWAYATLVNNVTQEVLLITPE